MVSHTHISTLVNLCIKECLDVMCFEWLAPWMAYPQLLLGYGDPFWWALLLWEVRHATDFQSIWQTRWSSWMETGLWCLNRLSKVSQHTAKCLTHCKGFEKNRNASLWALHFFDCWIVGHHGLAGGSWWTWGTAGLKVTHKTSGYHRDPIDFLILVTSGNGGWIMVTSLIWILWAVEPVLGWFWRGSPQVLAMENMNFIDCNREFPTFLLLMPWPFLHERFKETVERIRRYEKGGPAADLISTQLIGSFNTFRHVSTWFQHVSTILTYPLVN